ncbi:hypothetical protein PG988_011600 [Apiospora saccharicola]
MELDKDEIREACVRSDDRLPLLQAVCAHTIRLYQGRNRPRATVEHQTSQLLFTALRRALAQPYKRLGREDHEMEQDTDGMPNTVRWLLLDMQAPLWFDNIHVLTRVESALDWTDPSVIRSNLEGILARMGGDPNQVLPGYHRLSRHRDPRPIDLMIMHFDSAVELVALGGVDLTLASQHTIDVIKRIQAQRLETYGVDTNGRSLVELMRVADWPYYLRQRILEWCILNGTNDVPAHMELR